MLLSSSILSRACVVAVVTILLKSLPLITDTVTEARPSKATPRSMIAMITSMEVKPPPFFHAAGAFFTQTPLLARKGSLIYGVSSVFTRPVIATLTYFDLPVLALVNVTVATEEVPREEKTGFAEAPKVTS